MAFNFSGLGRAVVSGELPRTLEMAGERIGRAIFEPAFPTMFGTTSQGLAESYRKKGQPVRKFGPELPRMEGVDKEVEDYVSQTYDPVKPIEDHIRGIKTFVSSLFESNPNTPHDFRFKAERARRRFDAAESVAARDIAEMLKPLDVEGESPHNARFNATLISRHFLIGDTLAQMERDSLDTFGGATREQWQKSYDNLTKQIQDNPAMTQALDNLRGGLDEMFDDMVRRGWIIPERYLSDYSPVQKINTAIGALAKASGMDEGALRSSILGQTLERGPMSDLGFRESNLIATLHKVRTQYFKKVAQHEFFNDLIKSPWNMTEQFKDGETLPRGVASYRPGPGQVGFTFSTPEGGYLRSAADSLDPQGRAGVGAYLFPQELVDALNHFEPAQLTGPQAVLAKAGRALAKSLTVFNPRNTQLNRVSDLIVAMLGLPGEKARPMGILKFYGQADAAARAFVRGRDYFVKIGGKEVNISDLLVDEGIASATQYEYTSGHNTTAQLLKFVPESEIKQKNWFEQMDQTFSGWREATELAPRIAAGLEALERTGNIEEFGRVAREITFNYNEGSAQITNQPLLRFMAPFIKFSSAASKRMFEHSTQEGSRGRTMTAMLSVPTALMMWNNQNDDYKRVENSLPEYERTQLHYIVPGPDWTKPRRDTSGQPLVIRARYMITEEVAKTIGLGNLPSRFLRVAQGKDTITDFTEQSLKSIPEGVGQLTAIPAITMRALGPAPSGTKLSIPDRLASVLPILRAPFAAAQAARGGSIEPMVKELTTQAAGTTLVNVPHTQGLLQDTDLVQLRREISDAQQRVRKLMRSSKSTGEGRDPELEDAIQKLNDLREKAQRITSIVKSQGLYSLENQRGNINEDFRRRVFAASQAAREDEEE